ncbi:hypothetical protein DCC81_22155 [Chitinophaga parva]|uniref:PH domain-containing protein n=1 Tax=Chitinophaga parva TaxID=2169414 RepID=A0A2T7BDD6_9BACT|nr:hypothetical protein [Chitinophaga parva]PUZ23108.1 hypothetical protein DCC81_22155 [Chitinophaga parva]
MYIIDNNNSFWQVTNNVLLALCVFFFTWVVLSIGDRGLSWPLALAIVILAARNLWQVTFFDIVIDGNDFVISNLYFKKRRIPIDQFRCIEEGWAMPTRSGTAQHLLSLRLKDGRKYRFAIASRNAADVEKGIREYFSNHT